MEGNANEEGRPRRRRRGALIPVLALLALVTVPLAIWAVTSGDGDGPLRVEDYTTEEGFREVLVSVTDDSLNSMETNRGQSIVEVVCTDNDGDTVIRSPHPWPFPEEAGFDDRHAHVQATEQEIEQVASCELEGTTPSLSAGIRR